jgi:ppGpp synthetase/RelA/SpoT-type nucleotidyltranferase
MADVQDVRAAEIRQWYEAAQWRYRMFERAVFGLLKRTLETADLDKLPLESRTKELESFVRKATTPDPLSPDEFKYTHPQTEITDAVGLRIIVPLSTDVPPVRALLHENFFVEEETERGADEHLEVPGYQSLHLLVRLRERDRMDREFRDMEDLLFEIQVRTILQHAWASLQYDLTYKTARPPTPAIKRRLTALAGVLELADREFVQVRHDHGAPSVLGGAAAMAGTGEVNARSVRQLVDNVVGLEDAAGPGWFDALHHVLVELGLTDRQDLSAALGTWKERGAEVAAAVSRARPYASSAYIFDQVLRLALGEEYLERRLRHSDATDDYVARRAFTAERSALLRTLESEA